MVDWLIGFGIPGELMVVIISLLPIFELRGGIPVGIGIYHFVWYKALCLAIIGNLLPVPFLLLFFQTLVKYVRRSRWGQKLFNPIVHHAERRMAAIDKYGKLGLMIFVAVPLPGTGAWTGAIIASLLGMKFKRAFLSVAAGVIIAGAIVTALSLLGWVGAVIFGVGLCGLAIIGLRKA
jgi:uncharacterized membrane protein